jgi:hypothetical protein
MNTFDHRTVALAFGSTLGVSAATLARWEAGKHTLTGAGTPAGIVNIYGLVMQFFGGDGVKTALWFKTKNPSLGGLIPRDMIRCGRYEKLHRFVTDSLQNNATPTAT